MLVVFHLKLGHLSNLRCHFPPQRRLPLSCVLSGQPRNLFCQQRGTNGSTGVPGDPFTHAQTAPARSKCARVPSEVWGPQGPPGGTATIRITGNVHSLHLQDDVMIVSKYTLTWSRN